MGNTENDLLASLESARRLSPPADDAFGLLWSKFTLESTGESGVFPLPWPRLNDLSGGLRAGQTSVWAGAPNCGKSWKVLLAARHLTQKKIRWQLLPTEDNRELIARRVLAICAGSYTPLDRKPETGEHRLRMAENHRAELQAICRNILENPRRPVADSSGRATVPPFGPAQILEWADHASRENQVLFLDTLTACDLSSSTRDALKNEERFCSDLIGLMTTRDCCLVLTMHTKNRSGMNGRGPMTLDDISGSSK
jgi:hypothetical protein